MLTQTLRALWADARAGLLIGVLLVGASGCETMEVAEEPPEAVEPAQTESVIAPLEPEPVKGGIIVRLHSDSDAEMPDQSAATVTLQRGNAKHSATLAKGERLARFDALEQGRYDLLVTVDSDGVEVGSFSYFVDIGDGVGDVTVQVDFLRADLVVEAIVERSLDRRYVGTATMASGSCPEAQADSTVPSDLRLVTDGNELALTIANFQQETLQLWGLISTDAEPSMAAGTFDSSGGQSGAWQMTQLTAPSRPTIALALQLEDRTRSCEWTLEYAGLWEQASDSEALALSEAGATVEVAGHGRTWAATLESDESVARFDGLLVGPYEVNVGLRDGQRMVNSRRESVVLTREGARMESAFVTEWALPTSRLLLNGEERSLQGHAFEGKSVVTDGPPDCTGSIALVDTTTLTVSGTDSGLSMSFDNFYGKVLELNSGTEGASPLPLASGTYRSSDDKAGAWTMKRLAAPTSHSVAMEVAFSNETDSCQATYTFAGVR